MSLQDNYAVTLASQTFRALMAIIAVYDLEILQLDAVNAYLNSEIDEEVLVKHPEGYEQVGSILRLKKALYGLKQSPKLWYKTLSKTLDDYGLK